MPNALIYAAVVAVWGSSWLAIRYQLGVVPPEVSVVYRFVLSAVLVFAWAAWRGERLRFGPRAHLRMALLGVCLFCVNYALVYMASQHLTTGLVATVFSTSVVMNIVNGAIFLGRPFQPRVAVGAACGLAGIAIVFWPELAAFDLGQARSLGLVLVLAGTLSFSIGNMVATRNQAAGLPLLPSTAWSMSYGAAALAAYAALRDRPFVFDPSLHYVGSLLWLAVFATVIGFACYLTLLRRIGAERAAYATVLFPVVALSLSTMFEGYVWSPPALAGVGLILLGNVIVLSRPGVSAWLLRRGPAVPPA